LRFLQLDKLVMLVRAKPLPAGSRTPGYATRERLNSRHVEKRSQCRREPLVFVPGYLRDDFELPISPGK